VTLSALERFLRERLAQDLPGPEAQLRFAPRPLRKGWRPELSPAGAREAAALILIYPGADGPTIPLTVRRADLPHHPGQISLPGGRIDPGERPDEAALRETEEEIGVSRGDVRLIGRLSSLWVVVSNHVVEPFVGMLDDRPAFDPDPGEVGALLEVPVAAIRDPARLGWSRHAREGVIVTYPHFEFDGHHVWGATAMMLGEFAALFRPDFRPPRRREG
jgi:8-oxo-dGTP pyrophosphatase MutT (NUDIX family)